MRQFMYRWRELLSFTNVEEQEEVLKVKEEEKVVAQNVAMTGYLGPNDFL